CGAVRYIEARAEGRSQPIREPGEVGYFVPLIPALQILKQMREVHGGSVLEVAVGPLIGQSGQDLYVADGRGAQGCRVAGDEASSGGRYGVDRLGGRKDA